MKLILFDKGDESVGIFPAQYSVDCPFDKDQMDKEELEFFKTCVLGVYMEYGCHSAMYDFEIDAENKYYESIMKEEDEAPID